MEEILWIFVNRVFTIIVLITYDRSYLTDEKNLIQFLQYSQSVYLQITYGNARIGLLVAPKCLVDIVDKRDTFSW